MKKTPFTIESLLSNQVLPKQAIDEKIFGRAPGGPATQKPADKKRSKYRNTKCEYKGMKFDSIKEKDRYIELETNIAILHLERQKKFDLIVNGIKIATYKCDFHYYNLDDSQWVTEDVKSEYTKKLRIYIMKKRLMKALFFIDILET